MKTLSLTFAAIVLFFACAAPAQAQVVYANLVYTSPATAITVTEPAITGLAQYSSMGVTATIQGGTGGVLDIYIQVKAGENADVWTDYAHFTQLADGGAQVKKSFTTSKSSQQTTITTVGLNATPALAANSVLGGNFGDQVRVVFVAGAGTNTGGPQTFNFWFSK